MNGNHAKIYLSDASLFLVSSGNLTYGGLKGNTEGGVVGDDASQADELRAKFDQVWAVRTTQKSVVVGSNRSARCWRPGSG